ncbi:hypothetical protein ACJX0J_036665, partial [Zea mays]
RWKGNFRISSSVLFWYLRISRSATVPGLYLWGFFTPPVVGADFLAACNKTTTAAAYIDHGRGAGGRAWTKAVSCDRWESGFGMRGGIGRRGAGERKHTI